jgi:hypothetical protein
MKNHSLTRWLLLAALWLVMPGVRVHAEYCDQQCTPVCNFWIQNCQAQGGTADGLCACNWDQFAMAYSGCAFPSCTLPRGGGGGGGTENQTPGSDPIVIHLERDRPRFSNAEGGVTFDVYATGTPLQTAWPLDPLETGWLVLDRNGNGRIDDGGELFGNRTRLRGGTFAADGYEALAELDANNDGWVDQSDPGFSKLRLWRDLHRDGRSTAAELSSLASVGVARLSTDAHVSYKVDKWGNTFLLWGRVISLPHFQIERRSWDVGPAVIPVPGCCGP